MKKRMLIVLVLVAVLLISGGSAPVLAGSPRKITGGIHFMAPMFGLEDGWMRFNVREVGPGNSATGWLRWKEYMEEYGWRRVVAHPTCVTFGVYEGKPAAVFVVEIDSKRGWGDGEPGQYIKFWVLDGGTPGRMGDDFTTLTWPPAGDPPGCDYEDPTFLPFVVDGGNLVLHNVSP
jgi:hypothetical protein